MKNIPMESVGAELKAMLTRLQEQSLQGPLGELVPVIQSGFEENFAAAVDSSGSSWPPRKDDEPHSLLNETGALLAAVTHGGAPGNVTSVGDRELVLGVDKGVEMGGIPGAGVHNFGYGRVPQREFLYASEQTLDRALEVFADGAVKEIFEF